MKDSTKDRIKTATYFLVFLVPLFSAFVIQNLWNWFVADAIHAASISYWQALGLGMLVYFVKLNTQDFEQAKRWETTSLMLKACIPKEKKSSIAEAVKKDEDSWRFAVGADFARVVAGAVVLLVGWGVHTFLV